MGLEWAHVGSHIWLYHGPQGVQGGESGSNVIFRALGVSYDQVLTVGLEATYESHVGGHIWLYHCPQRGSNAICRAVGVSHDPVLTV